MLWDSANALGLVALAVSLYLFLFIGSGQHGRMHRILSYTIIACTIAHVLLLWIPDETVWHYLDTDMPDYMWGGLAALGALIATILLALPQFRRVWHSQYRHFKHWHYYLSLAIIFFSVWHITGSGFYFSETESWCLAIFAGTFVLAHRSNLKVRTHLSNSMLAATVLVPLVWLTVRLI